MTTTASIAGRAQISNGLRQFGLAAALTLAAALGTSVLLPGTANANYDEFMTCMSSQTEVTVDHTDSCCFKAGGLMKLDGHCNINTIPRANAQPSNDGPATNPTGGHQPPKPVITDWAGRATQKST